MLKLIRDNYEGIIDERSLFKIPKQDSSVIPFIEKKIHEELLELKDSDWKDVNEYADIIEVILKMAYEHGVAEDEIETARIEKLRKRGAFKENLIYSYKEEVTTC